LAAPLYDHPVLIIDPGMHTAPIKDVGVDAAGRIAVTGSDDKTLRVWSLRDGALLRTIRMPAGPGNIGKIYAVAVDPDGALVAAGGWTRPAPEQSIYVFETQTGKMAARIAGLPGTTHSLAFSPDGRYLAAGLSRRTNGLRVYDRQREWSEVFRDTDYGDAVLGVTFSADGRFATTSYDGKVRLYDRAFRLVCRAASDWWMATLQDRLQLGWRLASVTTMHRRWTFSMGNRWRRCRGRTSTA
jgi:WD40 repeat protein